MCRSYSKYSINIFLSGKFCLFVLCYCWCSPKNIFCKRQYEIKKLPPFKFQKYTQIFPRKIPFYFIINPHNCIYESIKFPFHMWSCFSFFCILIIVVTCFVIFKVNHGYQTVEDCKVYVTYKHRHCQTAKGKWGGGVGLGGGTAQVLLAVFSSPLNTFNNLASFS